MTNKYRQDGYQSGFEDAKAGKPNFPRPKMIQSFIFPRYMKEFLKGYSHGYNSWLQQERNKWLDKNARKPVNEHPKEILKKAREKVSNGVKEVPNKTREQVSSREKDPPNNVTIRVFVELER